MTYWPVFLSFIFYVIWCARLEAQVLNLKEARREHTELMLARETALITKLDSMQATMLELTKEVATLKGVLQSRKDN